MDKVVTPDSIPNLIGRNFVKEFREYLLSLIRENNLELKDITKKAFMEKNIKATTTEKYLKEMEEMEIIQTYKNKHDKMIYFIVGEDN